MSDESPYMPSNPKNIPLRPLNKGIVTDAPSAGIEDTAFLDCQNFIVGRAGPLRRPAVLNYASGDSVGYPPIYDIITMRKDDGSQVTVVIDSKFMYVVSVSGFTGYYWKYDEGFVSASGTALIGSGTEFGETSNFLFSGDVVVFDPSGTPEEVIVSSYTSNTLGVLEEAPSLDYSMATYEIRRAFGNERPRYVDYTILDNKIVFADSEHPLMSFDGTSFEQYSTDVDWAPGCVAFFKSRLHAGRIVDSAVDYRGRTKWTKVTDRTDFTTAQDVATFYDILENDDILRRLVPLGNLLVAYFEKSVWIGRLMSGGTTSLPVAYQQLETGGNGLVGDRAVYPWVDGHFAVLHDDIYFLSNAGSLVPIGSQVVRDTIQSCENLDGVFVMNDPKRERIVFGFPTTGDQIAKIWSYDWKAKAWSYDSLPSTFLSLRSIQQDLTYGDIVTYAATYGDVGTYFGTYGNITGSTTPVQLYFGQGGQLDYYADSGSLDYESDSIAAYIVTKDFDLGLPDTKKLFKRLSVKIDRFLDSDLSFKIEGSTDKGRTWKVLKEGFSIEAGDDENFCTFKMTGSTCRFRISSSSNVEPYRITEMVLRVRGRGLETILGPED